MESKVKLPLVLVVCLTDDRIFSNLISHSNSVFAFVEEPNCFWPTLKNLQGISKKFTQYAIPKIKMLCNLTLSESEVEAAVQ